MAGGGLLCCALDTELLGHWWYEGPAWLAAVLEEAPRQGLELVTVSEGIERAEPQQATLAPSTWGTRKDLSTWDSPRVGHIAIAARRAELRTVAATAGHPRAARGAGARRPRAARRCRPATGRSWPPASWPATTRASASRPTRPTWTPRWRRSGQRESRGCEPPEVTSAAVPEPALRNLAPDLDLAALTSP